MIHRAAAVLLLGLAIVAAGCGSAPTGDSDFTDVPGIGRTRIDVPRPTSPAAVGGPTKDCASDGLPSASSGSIKDRVAALRKIGFFADRKGDSDAAVAADVQSDIESASGSPADAGDRMLDLMVAATDANRVWWNDLEADVGPDNAVYEETLGEWAAISKGAFAPTGIKESWGADTGPVSVTYQLDGSKQTLDAGVSRGLDRPRDPRRDQRPDRRFGPPVRALPRVRPDRVRRRPDAQGAGRPRARSRLVLRVGRRGAHPARRESERPGR